MRRNAQVDLLPLVLALLSLLLLLGLLAPQPALRRRSWSIGGCPPGPGRARWRWPISTATFSWTWSP